MIWPSASLHGCHQLHCVNLCQHLKPKRDLGRCVKGFAAALQLEADFFVIVPAANLLATMRPVARTYVGTLYELGLATVAALRSLWTVCT